MDEHVVIKTLIMEDENKKAFRCVYAWRPAGFEGFLVKLATVDVIKLLGPKIFEIAA